MKKRPKHVRLKAFGMGLLVIALFGVPGYFQRSDIESEWSHAFGHYATVPATVIDHQPQFSLSRTCDDEVRVDVAWSGQPAPGTGYFQICHDEASRYPVGKRFTATVTPGVAVVGAGESRGGAVFSVILETLVTIGGIAFVAACFRTAFKRRKVVAPPASFGATI